MKLKRNGLSSTLILGNINLRIFWVSNLLRTFGLFRRTCQTRRSRTEPSECPSRASPDVPVTLCRGSLSSWRSLTRVRRPILTDRVVLRRKEYPSQGLRIHFDRPGGVVGNPVPTSRERGGTGTVYGSCALSLYQVKSQSLL